MYAQIIGNSCNLSFLNLGCRLSSGCLKEKDSSLLLKSWAELTSTSMKSQQVGRQAGTIVSSVWCTITVSIPDKVIYLSLELCIHQNDRSINAAKMLESQTNKMPKKNDSTAKREMEKKQNFLFLASKSVHATSSLLSSPLSFEVEHLGELKKHESWWGKCLLIFEVLFHSCKQSYLIYEASFSDRRITVSVGIPQA